MRTLDACSTQYGILNKLQMKLGYFTLLLVLACLMACSEKSSVPPDPLCGAWRLVEMKLILADGRHAAVPVHESLLIFSNGYYSIGYAFGDSSSVPYRERWHPDDLEKITRFTSVIVNTGSYTLDGSQLEARPLFALAPEFVGGKGIFSYDFVADTLQLRWEHSIAFDGLEYPSRGTVTLLRLVQAN
jgi:hypothetical protein